MVNSSEKESSIFMLNLQEKVILVMAGVNEIIDTRKRIRDSSEFERFTAAGFAKLDTITHYHPMKNFVILPPILPN